MKPNITSVFSWFKDSEIAEAHIERIKISKHLRKMQLILTEELPEDTCRKMEAELARHFRLNHVTVKKAESEAEAAVHEEEEYNINYKVAVAEEKRPVRDLGKAHTENVIYGSPIRSDLVPISSIN